MHHHKPYNFSLSISCHAGYQRAASTKHRLDQPLGSFILYPHPLKLAVNWTLNKTESERVYTQQQFSEETGHKPSQAERPGWHKQTLTAVSRFSLVPFQVNKQRIWIEFGFNNVIVHDISMVLCWNFLQQLHPAETQGMREIERDSSYTEWGHK